MVVYCIRRAQNCLAKMHLNTVHDIFQGFLQGVYHDVPVAQRNDKLQDSLNMVAASMQMLQVLAHLMLASPLWLYLI